MASCSEKFGNKVDDSISGVFGRLGSWVGSRPKKTIVISLVAVFVLGVGFLRFETENRGEELWVPQGTTAEEETDMYEEHFPSTSRFNNLIVQSKTGNVLDKESLMEALQMHQEMETKVATVDDEAYSLVDVCTKAGGSCASSFEGVCQCLITSILRQWNYDLTLLENDNDYMTTLREYGSREDLEAVLGNSVWDESDQLVSAEAFTLSYLLEDRAVVVDGTEEDPVNEGWEKQVFLEVADTVEDNYSSLTVDYLAARSFADEFGDAIGGDILLVQVSYVAAFLFLGTTLGKVKCGTGSRRALALGALVMVGISTAAGFAVSSIFGLFFGPVHSLLPFILLGIGVDDAFVIANAFDRERKGSRASEDDESLTQRCSRALARAGASITVTSLTDLVAFAISSSSSLPALASFCAYAAISIFFLWAFASTFFTACTVLDERRQRANRREILCCLKRQGEVEDEVFEEGIVSRYFRRYHAPAILSKPGKAIILMIFSGLLAFGLYGAMNLSVEDSGRNFVPPGSYLDDYLDATDEFFPSTGISFFIVFQGGTEIYNSRVSLADLDSRLSGLSTGAPYIAEPVSEEAYRNVMDGLGEYLATNGSGELGNVTLGDDNWPTNEADFVAVLAEYTSSDGPGAIYTQDVDFSDDMTTVEAYRVKSAYVKLTKTVDGEVLNDADKQIDAMDGTRDLIESWDDLPSAFPFSDQYIAIEGFKIIRRELFQNVGVAIAAVGVIVFFTVASPVTSLLITLNVAFCIIEILGFMYALGIVIDSVSVINIVLAVGLSVDYSAHVGHCFMVKGGASNDRRVTESLADIGAAVLNGGTSTFLAVAVLLFSSSYVFVTLSRQFALTVVLGLLHGLVALPVFLALLGPKPFSSAEDCSEESDEAIADKAAENEPDVIGETERVEKNSEEDSSTD